MRQLATDLYIYPVCKFLTIASIGFHRKRFCILQVSLSSKCCNKIHIRRARLNINNIELERLLQRSCSSFCPLLANKGKYIRQLGKSQIWPHNLMFPSVLDNVIKLH